MYTVLTQLSKAEMFYGYLAESDQIRWEEWKKRPLLLKIREWFSQLFARWSDTNVENGFAQVIG
jgi:hypothetical protein